MSTNNLRADAMRGDNLKGHILARTNSFNIHKGHLNLPHLEAKPPSSNQTLSIVNYETLFSVIPLKKGIQTRIGLIWISAGACPREDGGGNDRKMFCTGSTGSLTSVFLPYLL
ncbi:MAG: hypothetical protein AAB736_01200 [Patescibacteria group bacterium]